MKLWLDDLRSPPDDTWHWVTTVAAAKTLLERFYVEVASLDNDLGEGQEEGRRLVLWMAENEIWPESVIVHSANCVAGEYMTGMVDRYWKQPRRCPKGHRTVESMEGEPLLPCGCVLAEATPAAWEDAGISYTVA